MAYKRSSDQDPDYDDISVHQAKRIKLLEKDAKEAMVKKIVNIIKTQFSNAVSEKEIEIDIADQRLHQSRVMLDRLRAYIIAGYYSAAEKNYNDQTKQQQTSIHPAVKKILMGKAPPKTRATETPAPCSSAASETSIANLTEDTATSFPSTEVSSSSRPSLSLKPSAPPASPECNRASRFKVEKMIIVGNVSRYIPTDKRDDSDQSTHKWMVYVRGSKEEPAIHHYVKKVWFFLHPSYRPNDLVEISQPPFHLTRRGWGEFPVRVQLHFHDPRNKRVDIIHLLKLDKTYTALQTLGAETVVKVSIYKLDGFEGRRLPKRNSCNDEDQLDVRTNRCVNVQASGNRTVNGVEVPSKPLQIDEETLAGTFLPGDSHGSTSSLSDQLLKTIKNEKDTSSSFFSQIVGNNTFNDAPDASRTSVINSETEAALQQQKEQQLSFALDKLLPKDTLSAGSFAKMSTALATPPVPPSIKAEPVQNQHNTTNVCNSQISEPKQCTKPNITVVSKDSKQKCESQTSVAKTLSRPVTAGVSVLQKSLLRTNHALNQTAPTAKVSQTDTFTKPLLIVPTVPTSATPTFLCNNKVAATSLLYTSPNSTNLKSLVHSSNRPVTSTPVLLVPTLPQPTPKSSPVSPNQIVTAQRKVSNTLTQLTFPDGGISPVKPQMHQVPAVSPTRTQASVSLIKPPATSAASTPTSATPSSPGNNYYIKCVDQKGNLFLVPITNNSVRSPTSATQVRPQTPGITAVSTQGCPKSLSPVPRPNPLPTYMLQLIPSKPGASTQAQLVRLPQPQSTSPPVATVTKPAAKQTASLPALTKTANVGSAVSSGKRNTVEVAAEPLYRPVNIDELQTLPAILKCFVQRFPLIKENTDRTLHPYCASSVEVFYSWYVGKQRSAEVSSTRQLAILF